MSTLNEGKIQLVLQVPREMKSTSLQVYTRSYNILNYTIGANSARTTPCLFCSQPLLLRGKCRECVHCDLSFMECCQTVGRTIPNRMSNKLMDQVGGSLSIPSVLLSMVIEYCGWNIGFPLQILQDHCETRRFLCVICNEQVESQLHNR